jgi:uncharacterized integral membrane protein
MASRDDDLSARHLSGGNQAGSNDTSAASGRGGINPSLIGFGIVAILAVIFFFQNSNRIEVNFWLFDWNTTIRWSLLMAMFLGVLLDRLFGIWWRRRGKHKADAKRAERD